MHNYGHWKKTLALLVMSALSLGASSVDAMPEGGVIRSGEGAVSQNGREMTIRQDSGRLAMDWTNFNVGKDETVRFQQPGKDALALNRVTGNQQSLIDGSLLSNGHVLLVNPNGVVIGKNASIDVGGLVASTAHVKDNFMKEFGNSTGAFTLGGVSDGKIINEGTINAEGGLVALHAAKVENSGTIKSNGGSVLMAAADTLTLTPDTDGKLNFTVDGKVAEASALNKGAITADGGTIVMTADSASDVMSTVVNNEGTLQARTLRKNEKGQILLEGNDKGQVEVSGTLDASGTENGQDAGDIKVIGQKTIVHDGTNLLAKGDVNGGKIETSGDVLDLGDNLNIDAKGVNGKAGEWLLDPLDVIIADGDKADPRNGSNYSSADKNDDTAYDFTNGKVTIGYNDPAATNANATSVNTGVTWIKTETIEKILNAGTPVIIQAAATNGNANIIVENDIDKTSGDDTTLTLEAMRNITINGNITSTSNKLDVVLNADTNGDAIGAVIINKDITTNGGYFTSASGGNVEYKSDTANSKGFGKGSFTDGRAPDFSGHTVGTYFGHVNDEETADGGKDDRFIKTNGGNITLNGEVAIGLNGGTLTLYSDGGEVNVTGIINSGNSYGAYVYGTTTWDNLTADKVAEYLKNGEVPAYHYQFVNYKKDASGNYLTDENGNYVLDETINEDGTITYNKQSFSGLHYKIDSIDTQNVRFAADGTNGALSNTCVTQAGDGYSSVIVTKGTMTFAQWLQYEFQDTKVEFAKKYIPQSSGFTIKVGTDTKGNTTQTVVDSSGKAVSDAVLREYLRTAQQNENLATDETIMINGKTAKANITDDIERLLASNWFEAKELAQINDCKNKNTSGGSAVGDSYLATITTILENSLTTPNGQQILWAGGMGSGVLHKTGDSNNPYAYYGLPDDPTHSNGMYWVTGPEGEANNKKGTQFYSNVGSNWANKNYGETVYGYANWDTYTENNGKVTRYQPDNSSPFLTVGYGTTGKWDDAAMGGSTTVGFIKETNLANSSLNIKAGIGAVSLGGDIGKAKALDTVNIESTGAVTVGTDKNNNVTDYYHGTVYADHGVYISGGTVSVGGEIHSGTTDTTASASDITTRTDGYHNKAFQLDNVTIKSAGDLTVHGVESDGYTDSDKKLNGGKISLTSTGDSGKITLGAGVDYDGNATAGTLAAASAEKGAVIVDAQGTHGAFINSTNQEASAIKTGETTDVDGNKVKGTWLIYSASPDKDTFGTNLDSKTDAEWTAKSKDNANDTNSSGKEMHVYDTTDLTHTTNKYIFQVQPVITVSGADTTKTYGVEWGTDELKKLISYSASYVNSDNTPIDVATGKDQAKNAFTNAFTELDYKNYISNADGTKIGESNISYDSLGKKKTADRENGDKTDANGKPILATSDKAQAIYNLSVKKAGDDVTGIHGYDVITKDGSIEITKRKVTINQDGTITYGSNQGIAYEVPTSENATDITGLTNGDTIGSVTMTTSKEYQDSKGTRNTGDAGKYDLTTDGTNTHIVNNGKDVSVNYDISGSGTLTVEKATLTLDTGSTTKDYGDAAGVKDFLTDKEENYTLDGFVNGDENDTDKQNTIRGYIGVKNKSKALRDESHTNDVLNGGNSGYAIDTVATPNANLKNYNVVVKKGNTVTLKPVDINIYAEGNGSTLSDVTWTKIEKDKLVNGDSWDNGFTFSVEPGDLISYAEKTFGIKGYVNGQPISDGTQIGNYIYHPTGIVQLTFNPIVKPDVWAHSGGYRPRNKIETSLPVFRVEDAKVGQYGTYGVEHREGEDKLVLSATGMRLPEPDQVPDEERTFTTTLSTEEGSGTFKLEYNGVSLKVHPQDKKAEEVVRAGDKTKNVSLSEKALYVGYTEMGLDLIDLKGVYIYFN